MHNGHIQLALRCHELARLAEVRLLPVHIPAHRASPVASAAQRLAMLRLAACGHACLQVDERELQQDAPSYTIDSLQSLRREYGARSLCLILGMDAFQHFHTWRKWRAILEYAHIILADRPGAAGRLKNQALRKLFHAHSTLEPCTLQQRACGSILKLAAPMLAVSATQIRAGLAQEADVKRRLPGAVSNYIHANRLYAKR